jgi:hypothetical protein
MAFHNSQLKTAFTWLITVACVGVLAQAETRRADMNGPGGQTAQRGTQRIAVRNDVARPRNEVLVLRNHELRPGGHEPFFQISRDRLWPFGMRVGVRVVGQWKVVDPEGRAAPNYDDVYRLARYANFDHWLDTRDDTQTSTGGNGPAADERINGIADRVGAFQTGSKGAYFLQGRMAPGGPYYMPGLKEQYELVPGERPAATDDVIAVRHDVSQPGQELVEFRYERIRKGTFERFVQQAEDAIWPWEEKLGARPIGQWKVIYPKAPSRTSESPDFDEVITLTRYASYAHWKATRPDQAVFLGGNGVDWRTWRAALGVQRGLTIQARTEFMEGFMFYSPPTYLPSLPERYRISK